MLPPHEADNILLIPGTSSRVLGLSDGCRYANRSRRSARCGR